MTVEFHSPCESNFDALIESAFYAVQCVGPCPPLDASGLMKDQVGSCVQDRGCGNTQLCWSPMRREECEKIPFTNFILGADCDDFSHYGGDCPPQNPDERGLCFHHHKSITYNGSSASPECPNGTPLLEGTGESTSCVTSDGPPEYCPEPGRPTGYNCGCTANPEGRCTETWDTYTFVPGESTCGVACCYGDGDCIQLPTDHATLGSGAQRCISTYGGTPHQGKTCFQIQFSECQAFVGCCKLDSDEISGCYNATKKQCADNGDLFGGNDCEGDTCDRQACCMGCGRCLDNMSTFDCSQIGGTVLAAAHPDRRCNRQECTDEPLNS